MCGIQLTKKETKSGIEHRGVNQFYEKIYSWHVHFASLPINSNGSGLNQPVELKNGYLVFNGEIFNYKKFGNYRSDVHYLKSLFEKGIENNKKFQKDYKLWDGFWSICIIDKEGVTMFTDPLGKKQLYYSEIGICSEIKPLRNKNMLMGTPKMGTLNTCFQHIYRAMPGEFYRYENEFGLAYKAKTYSFSYLKRMDLGSVKNLENEMLISLINESVLKRAVVNYGKLGLLFSGGLDSSIMAYHLIKNKIPFQAISIENNEKDNAEKMASYLGFNIEYIDDVMQEDDYEKAVVAYEHNLDYGSLMPQYKLFKKAKQLGINTVITGDGADELFGGYGRCLIEDTQRYDIFQELPYFHHIRIDRMSMMHTIEARNPFLSTEIILFALSLPYNKRKGKSILKEAYRDLIPFVDMKKKPLRLKGDKQYNIENINSKFYKYYAKTI